MAAAAGGVFVPLPPPCAFSPHRRDFLAVSGLDGRITVWDCRTGSLRREYVPSAHLSATCSCLAWAPSRGKQESHPKKKRKSESVDTDEPYDLLTIGTATGTILLYSVVKGELQSKLAGGHDNRVNCIRWHQDNGCLYSCSDDTHIVEWSTQTYKVKRKWKGDKGSVSCLCISPDGKMLLSAGRTIKLWDLETQTQTRQFTGHATAVTSLMFIRPLAESKSSGWYFLSGAVNDRLISVWQVRQEAKERSAVLSFNLTDYPVAVDLAHSESKEEPLKLAIVCRDGQLHLFEHVLNGNHKKPVSPACTIQIATPGQEDSTPKPLPILSTAFFPDRESICLFYGSTMLPVIEKLVLKTDEPQICLIRDPQKAVTLRNEREATAVKTPITKTKMNVLVPGIPGHSAALTLPSQKQDGKRKPGDKEASIEERLSAMDIDLTKVPKKGGLPQADSFAVLLAQGLESRDTLIINKVLQTRSGPLIRRTVAELPIYAIIPLVHELTRRLQGHPTSALLTVRWIKAVLLNHASYLSTLPDLVHQLGSLYQLMETRVKTLQKMSRLNGKLYLLVSHVTMSDFCKKTEAKQAQLVYEEESSEEESVDEDGEQHTDSDDNWEEGEEEEEEESETEDEMNVDEVDGDSEDSNNESEEE